MTQPRPAGPIRRTIVTPRTPSTRPGQNLALRPATVVEPPVHPRNRRAVKMTGAQRDTTGKRSDWSRPQNIRPGTTPMMPAWSHTVSNRPAATADVSMRGTGTSRTR